MRNPFMRFAICERYKKRNGCEYFGWIDQPHQEEGRYEIVSLMHTKKELENEVAMKQGMIKKLYFVISISVALIFALYCCK